MRTQENLESVTIFIYQSGSIFLLALRGVGSGNQ